MESSDINAIPPRCSDGGSGGSSDGPKGDETAEAAAGVAALAARARRGDRSAFDHLVASSQDRALRFASSQLDGDWNQAQDAVQSAFIEAWRDLPQLRDPAAFSAWLRQIVFKQCDRIRRAQQRRHSVGLQALGDIAVGTAAGTGVNPDPAKTMISAELQDQQHKTVRLAVLALPAGQRDAVLLFYLCGCSHRDVAHFLGVSVAAVKSRLHAARQHLRERIPMMNEMVDKTGSATARESDDQRADALAAARTDERIDDEMRQEVLGELSDAYARLCQAFALLDDVDGMLAMFTPDYELIFPEWFHEPTWDKSRIERDLKKAGPRASRLTMTAVIEDLLSVKRDPETGAVAQATVRITLINGDGFANRDPTPRIDTWVAAPPPGQGWKMQRTLSLYQRDKGG